MSLLKKIGKSDDRSVEKEVLNAQKKTVIVLAALAVLIVIFWVWRMQAKIDEPFAPVDQSSSATSTDLTTVLKSTDTDGDGLSDYDEIYVYHTSPYLEDTDSDGISDLQEIEQGTDPNCPQGQNCSGATEEASSTLNIASSSVNTLGSAPDNSASVNSNAGAASSLNASGTDTAVLQSAMDGQIDAASLRQLLINSGADKTELDKYSDADLMTVYQETLKNQQSNTASSSDLNSSGQ